MNTFKQFNLPPAQKGFAGDKIKIKKILNTEISVLDFKIQDSKFEGKGKRLDLQIEVKGVKHLIFTSATNLMEDVQRIPADGFPFLTTIVEENERYQFT